MVYGWLTIAAAVSATPQLRVELLQDLRCQL
jgi:hypothetical protein